MTIAKCLVLLLVVPLVAPIGLGIRTRIQLATVEARSRFVAESRIADLATQGHLSRRSAGLRLDVRGT